MVLVMIMPHVVNLFLLNSPNVTMMALLIFIVLFCHYRCQPKLFTD